MSSAAQRLRDLPERCCRWPIGEGWGGQPVAGSGKPYCSEHQARAWSKVVTLAPAIDKHATARARAQGRLIT